MPHARSTAQLIDPTDGHQLAVKPGTDLQGVVDAIINTTEPKDKRVENIMRFVRVRKATQFNSFKARVAQWVDHDNVYADKKDKTCVQFYTRQSNGSMIKLLVSLQWEPEAEPVTLNIPLEPQESAEAGWCCVM